MSDEDYKTLKKAITVYRNGGKVTKKTLNNDQKLVNIFECVADVLSI